MRTKEYRQISFDLKAKKIESKGLNPSDIYEKIRKILYQNNFRWNQYSGYISNEPIDIYQVKRILNEIKRECPELKGCVRKWTITIYDASSDYTDYMDV